MQQQASIELLISQFGKPEQRDVIKVDQKQELKNENVQSIQSPLLFINNKLLSDIVVMNGSLECFCHKVVLASHSKYFLKQFSEKNEPKISLPQQIFSISEWPQLFNDLLVYFYMNDFMLFKEQKLNNENDFLFYYLVCTLDCEKLEQLMEQFLVSKIVTQNCVKVILQLLKLKKYNLMPKCVSVLAQNLDRFISSTEKRNELIRLPFDVFYQILNNELINVENEDQVLLLVLNYIDIRKNNTNLELNEKPQQIERQNSAILIVEQKKEVRINENNKTEEQAPKNVEDIPKEQEKIEDAPKENEIKVEEVQQKEEEKPKLDENPEVEQKLNDDQKPIDQQAQQTNKNVQQEGVLIEGQTEQIQTIQDFEKQALSEDQKKLLLLAVRLVSVNHDLLLQSSFLPCVEQFKTIFIEAISAKLNKYEKLSQSRYNVINPQIGARKGQQLTQTQQSSNLNDLQMTHSVQLQKTNQRYEIQEMPKKSFYREPTNQVNLQSTIHDSILSVQQVRSKQKITFKFSHNFDENGAIYFLATKNKKQIWENPHLNGLVRAFSSSLRTGSIHELVGLESVNLTTINQKNSFFGIDFGLNRELLPSCYTIRNRNSSSHVMLNWILEASNDFYQWFVIDKRVHLYNTERNMELDIADLMTKGATSTWGIDQNVVNNALKTINSSGLAYHQGFRYFRFLQIDVNSHGSDNLCLSGIEFYGTAYGDAWLL